MVKSYLYHFFWHKFSVIYRSLSTWQKAFILLIPGYIVLLFTFLGGKSVKSDPYFFCFRNPPSARSLLWVPPSSLANVSQSNLFQMMIIQQQQQQQQQQQKEGFTIETFFVNGFLSYYRRCTTSKARLEREKIVAFWFGKNCG